MHDDDARTEPCPTGREWRVNIAELSDIEATLNAMELYGFRALPPDRIHDDTGPARWLLIGLFDPADWEPDEEDAEPEEGARPLPDATCEQG